MVCPLIYLPLCASQCLVLTLTASRSIRVTVDVFQSQKSRDGYSCPHSFIHLFESIVTEEVWPQKCF